MNGEKKPNGGSFESFKGFLQHEARIDTRESFHEHAKRIVEEVRQDLEEGISTHEEAIALLAKLDIVPEATKNPVTLEEARKLRSDIEVRYPTKTI